MSKHTDFKEFYNTKLLPDLIILDRERRQVDRRIIIIVIITIVLIITEAKLIPSGNSTLSGILQFTTGILGFISVSVVSKTYRLGFKSKIISKIAGFVDDSLSYIPVGLVPLKEFLTSAIFQQTCNAYQGEDLFRGKMNKTNIEFSEIVARHKTTTGTGSKKKDSYSTIFKGIFFVADFNKNFKSKTLVLPDTAERLFGKIGQNLQSISHKRGELIKLEDPEFEKEFCVYGEDQIESRYILSTSLMRRILEFKIKWKTKVYLSFINSKVFIAIKMKKNLFETRLFKSIVDYSFMEENMQYLILLTGIVEDLNLNTRVWTKK